MKSTILFLILAFVAICGQAHAQIIVNVKYGDNVYNGSGAAGGGTSWNYFSGSSGSSLLNLATSTGTTTVIDISTTFASSFGGNMIVGSTPSKLFGSGKYGPYTFTIGDLDLSKTYNLYLYVYNKSNESTTIDISTPGGSSATPSPTNISSSFALNQNYVVFTGLTPNGSGQIIGSVSGAWTGLNGLQLQVIPEPSTGVLVFSGMLLMVAIRHAMGNKNKC